MNKYTKGKDQVIVGSSGALERYSDTFKDLKPEDAEIAETKEQEIRTVKLRIEGSFLVMAELLDEFERNKYYLACGWESMQEWCKQSHVDLSWRVVQDLLRINREVRPVLQEHYQDEAKVTQALLLAGVSKVRTALPLVRDPDAFVEEIERASQTPWSAFREEVKERQGVGSSINTRQPVVFRGTFDEGPENTRVSIHAMDGVTIEPCGSLVIRNEWVPRWMERFGKLVVTR